MIVIIMKTYQAVVINIEIFDFIIFFPDPHSNTGQIFKE